MTLVRTTHRTGTHRVCAPEETWERVRPLLRRAGITRVADLTWMDDIGIPIFQAVRPMSRSLSVSQGKGVTAMHSRVSAVMESFEVFHAEDPVPATVRASSDALGTDLTYDPRTLHLRNPTLFHEAMVLEWFPARVLGGDRDSFVPADVVNMDTSVDGRLRPLVFHRNSNGLASGNTPAEATAHALYEIIERDCHATARNLADGGIPRVDPLSLRDESRTLVSQFLSARATVEIRDVTNEMRVPCFQVRVWSPTYPVICFGAGCHSDPQVAMCRALTEAAQSRATAISGTREDIEGSVWTSLQQHTAPEPHLSGTHPVRCLDDVAIPWVSDSMEEDVARLGERVAAYTGIRPLAVDLTRPDFAIPVVKVLCPGMRVYMP